MLWIVFWTLVVRYSPTKTSKYLHVMTNFTYCVTIRLTTGSTFEYILVFFFLFLKGYKGKVRMIWWTLTLHFKIGNNLFRPLSTFAICTWTVQSRVFDVQNCLIWWQEEAILTSIRSFDSSVRFQLVHLSHVHPNQNQIHASLHLHFATWWIKSFWRTQYNNYIGNTSICGSISLAQT